MSLGHRPRVQQSALGWPRRVGLPAAGRASSPTPCFSGPRPHRGRPREGTDEVPQPRVARAAAHHLLRVVANLCLRAPRVPESPAWRSLRGELGLESLLGPALGFLGADTRRRGSRPSAGRAGNAGAGPAPSACAHAGPRGHIWAWALFGCAPARSQEFRESRPPPSPPWRELGATGGNGREPRRQQGGGFPGALWPYRCGPRDPGAPPRLCVLGLVGAGTPGLGQAQKSPFPDQAPNGGSGDRGGCAEPGVTAGSGASISRRAPSAPGATTGSCTLRGWALQRDGPRQIVGSSIRACICQCSEGWT